MRIRYQSIAAWPSSIRLGTEDNTSTDTHDTREQAEAVLKMLRERGFGGDGKVFPLWGKIAEVNE